MPLGGPSRPPEVPGARLIWERFVDKAVLKVQQRMFSPVSSEALRQFSRLLNAQFYEEVVEERAANRLCGFPTCDRPIEHDYTGQMRISLARRQLCSLEALNRFCSEECLCRNAEWQRQLGEESIYGRADLGPLLKSLFPMLTDKELRKLSSNLVPSSDVPTPPLAAEVKVREATPLGAKPTRPQTVGAPERKLPSRRQVEFAALPDTEGAAGTGKPPTGFTAPNARNSAATVPVQANPKTGVHCLAAALPATPASPNPPTEGGGGRKADVDLLGLTDDLSDLKLQDVVQELPDSDEDREVVQAKCVGPFALLWDCLTDWVTASTRAYCHSGVVAPPTDPQPGEEDGEGAGLDSDDEGQLADGGDAGEQELWSSSASQRRGALYQMLYPVFPAVAQGLQLGSIEPLHRLSNVLDTFRYPKPIPSLNWKTRQLLAFLLLRSLRPQLPALDGPIMLHGPRFVEHLGFGEAEVRILSEVLDAVDE